MKRRNFIKGLLGLAAVPVIAKAGIGDGSKGLEKPRDVWEYDGSEGGSASDYGWQFEPSQSESKLRKGDMITIGDDKTVYVVGEENGSIIKMAKDEQIRNKTAKPSYASISSSGHWR